MTYRNYWCEGILYQMKLIEALESGQTSFGMPDRIIETVLAKLFFFGDRVIKVYKHRNQYAEPSFRKRFYIEDFTWNNIAAPQVYTKLHGFDETLSLTDLDTAHDWAIEMKNIDTSSNLTRLLPAGAIDGETMTAIAEAMIENLENLTREKRDSLSHIFDRSYTDLRIQSLRDLDEWLSELHTEIPAEVRSEAIRKLSDTIANDPYFNEFTSDDYRVAKDTNSDNILWLGGKASFIDIMPPNEHWRVNDPHFALIRTAVDAEVLGDASLPKSVHDAREKAYGTIPSHIVDAYALHGALIQWAYRTMLGQHDLAKKYGGYALRKLKK